MRLLVAAALAVAPLAGVAATVPASPASAAATPAATLPIDLELRSISPTAPQPHGTLVVTGSARNISDAPVTAVQLELRVGRSHFASRGAFDAYADTAPVVGFPDSLAGVSRATVTTSTRALAPGQALSFRISVPTDDLSLPTDSWQVYPLGVRASGVVAGVGTQTVARLRTFLPWAPVNVPGTGKPTPVAWVWPLVDRPHRGADGKWLDDDLAAELAAGGRLRGLVDAATKAANPPPPARAAARHTSAARKPATPTVHAVPVTVALDPLLVDDATAMSHRYTVATTAGSRSGTGTQAAVQWLASLRSVTARSDVLPLPYADPDVVAAVRGGLTTQTQVAVTQGETVLRDAFGSAGMTTTMWPPGGEVNEATLETVIGRGATTVVLDDDALPITGAGVTATPGANATLVTRDGTVTVVLVDDVLQSVVGAGAADPTMAPASVQRFLGETLMVQSEAPSTLRSVVVAPDRRWSPSPAYASALLTATARAPWITPTSLRDVASSPAYAAEGLTRAPLQYSTAARAAELPPAYVAHVRGVEHILDAFSAILPADQPGPRALASDLRASLSSAYRHDVALGEAHTDSVADELATQMGRVHIASAPKSLVTLTSHSGSVPITVSNELDTPVTIVVALQAAGNRLVVSGSGRLPRTIPPHTQVAVDIRATAKTSGVFPLTVSLLTPSGQPYGAPVSLYVRSTVYGSVALWTTGIATLVLLAAVAVRVTRRWLRSRRTGAAPEHSAA